jgi:hypothetical protein
MNSTCFYKYMIIITLLAGTRFVTEANNVLFYKHNYLPDLNSIFILTKHWLSYWKCSPFLWIHDCALLWQEFLVCWKIPGTCCTTVADASTTCQSSSHMSIMHMSKLCICPYDGPTGRGQQQWDTMAAKSANPLPFILSIDLHSGSQKLLYVTNKMTGDPACINHIAWYVTYGTSSSKMR